MVSQRQGVEAAGALARELAERFELAGLAVGIVQDGETIYADGFGVQSLETGSPITPDSMFRVASMTKPFVATAIMQLVEAGDVRLDAPVVEYLPSFQIADARDATSASRPGDVGQGLDARQAAHVRQTADAGRLAGTDQAVHARGAAHPGPVEAGRGADTRHGADVGRGAGPAVHARGATRPGHILDAGLEGAGPRQTVQVTVRHLLQHTSGLPRSYHEPEPDDDRRRYLHRNAEVRLAAAPGNRFLYSNLGYDILGELIATVSGQPFEDYVRNLVLGPSGMPTSTFPPATIDPQREASPHLNGPHPIQARLDPTHPANNSSKGLVSSTSELCNWAITTLSRGRSPSGDEILAPASYDGLWSPQKPTAPTAHEPTAGLGWFLGERHGRRTVQKGGSLTGYGSSLILAPDHRLGIVVLSNSYPVPKDAIAAALLDVMLGHVPDLPKPLVLHEIYPTLIRDGQQAALAQHNTLRAERPGDFDFGGGQYYEIGWANLLTALHRPREATQVIGLGAALNPDSDAYHHLLALAYDECDETQQAIRSLERCLALNPGHQGANDLLARLKRAD